MCARLVMRGLALFLPLGIRKRINSDQLCPQLLFPLFDNTPLLCDDLRAVGHNFPTLFFLLIKMNNCYGSPPTVNGIAPRFFLIRAVKKSNDKFQWLIESLSWQSPLKGDFFSLWPRALTWIGALNKGACKRILIDQLPLRRHIILRAP